jgi:signal transduction histidine kinase
LLLNLLGYAVKFTAHGEVTVEAGIERENENTICARFAVRDTGPGIRRTNRRSSSKPFDRPAVPPPGNTEAPA